MANYPLNNISLEDTFSQFRSKVNDITEVVNSITEDIGSGVAGLYTFKTITDGVSSIIADSLNTELRLVGGNNITLNYNPTTKEIEIVGTAVGTSIDDTPVDGNTTVGISSNWAFDHINGTIDLHTKLGILEQDIEFGTFGIKDIGYIKRADNITIISFDNDWLRINHNNTSSSGVYFGNSVIRTDGEFQVGSTGSIFKVSSTSFTYNGNDIMHKGAFRDFLFDDNAGITNKEIIAWDSANNRWINMTAAEAGLASSSLIITTGAGLSGGGNLTGDLNIDVNFGTTAGTVAEGDHSHTGILADAENKMTVAKLKGTVADGVTFVDGLISTIEYNYAPSGDNIVTEFTYDSSGKIKEEKWKNGLSGSVFATLTYSYNTDGTIKEIIRT